MRGIDLELYEKYDVKRGSVIKRKRRGSGSDEGVQNRSQQSSGWSKGPLRRENYFTEVIISMGFDWRCSERKPIWF